jgi:hypothetical protein
VGYPDQFAKDTFAEETERVTGGAVVWQDPPEIGLVKLVKVQGDGLLLVRRPDLLAVLGPPWSEARGYLQVLLEAKMPGDHLNEPTVERAVLRCVALHVQRLEGQEPPWPPAAPLWMAAPHVPMWLRRERTLRLLGPAAGRWSRFREAAPSEFWASRWMRPRPPTEPRLLCHRNRHLRISFGCGSFGTQCFRLLNPSKHRSLRRQR